MSIWEMKYNMSVKNINAKSKSELIRDFSQTREMKVYVGDDELRVFLQNGFFEYDSALASSNFHNHRYSEIHIVFSGTVDFLIEGRLVRVESGRGIIIPIGVYHTRLASRTEASVCAFQVGIDVRCEKVEALEGTELVLGRAINEYKQTGNGVRLALAVGLICSYFHSDVYIAPTTLCDRELIIYEFFANNYDKDVSLSDIAAQLRLSEKQAERLIIKSTGMSFRRQIVAKRIENARMLVKTEGISLAKAAEKVGYQSYSGFWKALQSYEASARGDRR